MNISLIPIPQEDKKALAGILSEYQKELLGENSPSEYKYLDSYWESADRFPFFIALDGKRVGFVFVNGYTLVIKNAQSIAEFYIAKEFRKKGIGRIAAIKTFELFPGKWEIREMKDNIVAQGFWRKVISDYTNNEYAEIILNNNQWNGPVQTFDKK
jgi:predicted acetyltransferase